MKKAIVALGCIAFFGLASCKKDYTCTCTTPDPLGGADVVVKNEIPKAKKSDAETACDNFDTAAKLVGGNCTLD